MRYKVVTPTCTGIVPRLWMALNFSDSRNKAKDTPIHIYIIKDTRELQRED